MSGEACDDAYRLQPEAIARAFDRASRSYDAAARLQRTVREELLSRLEGVRLSPRWVLDLGAGTGVASAALKRRYPRAQVVALDVAPGMLREARRHSRPWRPLRRICGSAMRLPLTDRCMDLAFSSLMFQWCDDLDGAFAEVRRVLAPGGLLLFSTFGPDTLRELRGSWAAADPAVHVNRFIDMHDLGAALQRNGFVEPVLDVDRHVLHYAEVPALMRELKAIGAHNLNAGRTRTLTGKNRFARVAANYESLRTASGLPATYEVVYGAAWAGAAEERFTLATETRLPLSALAARLRSRRPTS